MRLWIRYLREKRVTLILYFLTAALFLAVGSLYHIENLGKMFYASLLTLAVWAGAGLLEGMKYVRRSRRLEEIFRHFEHSGEVILGDGEKAPETLEASVETAESYQDALVCFLAALSDAMAGERADREEKEAERGDYYLMWTHQIKTPISAMKLLLNRPGLPEKDSFLLREELFKIEQYVEMVLAFQRLESIASDLVLQEYDLGSLVRQAVKKFSILFINKGLKLDLGEMDFRIVTDEKWFVFCLEQLLSNSIKYTPRGGISMAAQQKGDRAVFWLEDTGIGIRGEDLPRIFDRGFTGYNGRLEKRSTGIGLYLCKRIYKHLGITVQVESRKGQGTRVMLEVPGPAQGGWYKE